VKFGYAIVLALVALVAVTGFASADRLPQQVPENQIFTIDTLIDVTGAVSQESEMQWTLDSQDAKYSGVLFDTNTMNPITNTGWQVTGWEYEYLKSLATAWAGTYGSTWTNFLQGIQDAATGRYYIRYFYAPDDELLNMLQPWV